MTRALELSGLRFGRWTVVERVRRVAGYNETCWLCICDCGVSRVVGSGSLRKGASAGCGCIVPGANRARLTTHGSAPRGRRSPEYRLWTNMRTRCSNPRVRSYADYGGRGIRVCERWNEFADFLADVGQRPTTMHSLDRIDNDGNYEPGNVRWATAKQQQNNKRNSLLITHLGRTMTAVEWAATLGVPVERIYGRYYRGETSPGRLLGPRRKVA